MRYFKRYWNEPREYNHPWGCSWFYFETDKAGIILRQIEMYERGPTFRYSTSQPVGEFGRLSDQPLDLVDFTPFEIGKEEFERTWETDEQSDPAIHTERIR
jgi:hypothetical protein